MPLTVTTCPSRTPVASRQVATSALARIFPPLLITACLAGISFVHGCKTSHDAHRDRANNLTHTDTPLVFDTIIVSYNLDSVRQQGGNTCWAAALTMLYNWKHGTSLNEASVVNLICPELSSHYRYNRPLENSDKTILVKTSGLDFRYGQSYMCEALVKMMQTHGPLWFTTEFNTHANVLYAVSGSGSWESTWIHLIDPADGTRRIEAFSDFHRRYEAAAFSAEIFAVFWPTDESPR